MTGPVTSPKPEPANTPVSYTAPVGVSCCSSAGREELELERIELDLIARGLELCDDVVDAGIVARSSRRACPAIVVRDLLQRCLMGSNTIEGHALQELLLGIVAARGAGRAACLCGRRDGQSCRNGNYAGDDAGAHALSPGLRFNETPLCR